MQNAQKGLLTNHGAAVIDFLRNMNTTLTRDSDTLQQYQSEAQCGLFNPSREMVAYGQFVIRCRLVQMTGGFLLVHELVPSNLIFAGPATSHLTAISWRSLFVTLAFYFVQLKRAMHFESKILPMQQKLIPGCPMLPMKLLAGSQ